MKFSKTLFCAIVVSFLSFNAGAEITLNVKIAQVVDSQTVESVKSISANYNQDIVISETGLKNKIVINLKKFKNILVNGTKINPVQIDMKVVDSSKKTVGKTHTVTSFYNNSAQFTFPDRNVSLNFQEI